MSLKSMDVKVISNKNVKTCKRFFLLQTINNKKSIRKEDASQTAMSQHALQTEIWIFASFVSVYLLWLCYRAGG